MSPVCFMVLSSPHKPQLSSAAVCSQAASWESVWADHHVYIYHSMPAAPCCIHLAQYIRPQAVEQHLQCNRCCPLSEHCKGFMVMFAT